MSRFAQGWVGVGEGRGVGGVRMLVHSGGRAENARRDGRGRDRLVTTPSKMRREGSWGCCCGASATSGDGTGRRVPQLHVSEIL